MSEEVESPFAILDTPIVETAAGDSAEATPAEANPEEAPAETAKAAEEKPESEGEEKAEETAKPDAEPETKDGEKAEAEEPEPIDGEPPKLKEFISKHKLSGEEKRWLKKEVYQNKEFREIFPDIREAKDFRSTFPAPEDWQAAAQARDGFYRASTDFEQNPKAFRDGLKSTSPEAYARFVETVAEDLPTVAPKAKLEIVSEGLVNVFDALKARAAKNGVAWTDVTAADIEEFVFSNDTERAPEEDPRVAKILEENRKLKALQQNETQKNVAAVASVLDSRVSTNVGKEAQSYLDRVIEQTGADYSDAQKAMIVKDLASRVMQSYRSNTTNTHAKKAIVDALARNQIRPEDAVGRLAGRARPEFNRLGPDVIRHWTEVFVGGNKKTVQKAKETQVERKSATRDVPQMATTPSGPVIDKAALLKKDKGAFWDTVFGS